MARETQVLECKQCGGPGDIDNLRITTETKKLLFGVLVCAYCGTQAIHRIKREVVFTQGGINIADTARVIVGRDMVGGNKYE